MPTIAELLQSAAALNRAGQLGAAEEACRQILQSNPNHAEACRQLGDILLRQGRLAEAEASLRAAVRLRPGYAEAHSHLGDVLREQGRLAEAEAAYREAIRLRPGFAEAYANLGIVLRDHERWAEADAAYREALRLRPDFAEAYNGLGVTRLGLKRSTEAEAAFREAIRLRPDFAEAFNNFGNALGDQDRLAEAEAAYREAIRLRPGYPEAHSNLGNALRDQGRWVGGEAEAEYREAIRLRPAYARGRTNLGLLLLSQGRYREGWPEYEWRWRTKGLALRASDRPAWDGSPLPGGTLLLYAEQGYGDTIQFARYAALVKDRAGTVVLECPPPLMPLLQRCPGIDRLVAQGSPPFHFDAHAPLVTLPRLLGTTVETIPARVPYLSADPERIQRWRQKLAAVAGLCEAGPGSQTPATGGPGSQTQATIGIAWQGNPGMGAYDRRRSFPLAALAPLARLPGVRLIVLQKGPGREQLKTAPADWPLIDLGNQLDESAAFVDTAAVMASLDLVIACDSAVTHVAGALGVPTWVPLPLAADWRWLLEREDSPWYPTLRLFRQSRAGDWADVFRRMADALRQRLLGAAARTADPNTVAKVAELLRSAAAMCRAGQLAQAEQTYQQVLELQPGHAEALGQLGLIAYSSGRPALAVDWLRRATAAQPDSADWHNTLGAVLASQGRSGEAEVSFRQAVRLRPGFVEAHSNLGNALRERGLLNEAETAYREALRLRPSFAEAHNNLGNALCELNRPAEGEAAYREALRLRPDYAEAHNNLGDTLREQKRLNEAETAYREALRLRPGYAEAHNNLGMIWLARDRYSEAETAFREATRHWPGFSQAHNNLGNALRDQGRLAESEAAYREALRLKPGYAEAHVNLGLLLLSQGRFGEGWAEYEWRWRSPDRVAPVSTRPAWDGTALGREMSILLHAEQGFGDTIQFVRYAAQVKQLIGTVIVECQPPLLPLLSRCPGIDRLVTLSPRERGANYPPHDTQAPLASLPYLLGTKLETIPAPVPYLTADPALVERWRGELTAVAGLCEAGPGSQTPATVGIAWQGNPNFPGDRRRSLPLAALAPLAQVPGVQLVVLQKGPGREQLASAPADWPLLDIGERLETFADTAAVMASLDLVVTCDSAVAHVAGALGRPVWLALAHVADWRWLRDRDDSPWYPTLRLFRQTQPGDWAGVFERMAAALREQLADKR